MCKSKQSAVIVSVTCPARCVGSNWAEHSNGQTTSLFLPFFPLINLSSSYLKKNEITEINNRSKANAQFTSLQGGNVCKVCVSKCVGGGAEGVGSDTNTVPQTWKMVQSEQFCLISWKITYPGTTKSYITEVYAMRNVSGVTRNSLPIQPGN